MIIRNDDGDEDNKEEGEGRRGEGEERREGREGEGREHCIYQTINDIIKKRMFLVIKVIIQFLYFQDFFSPAS